jgi:GMP synthase-like glutamine amidotransferase
VILFLDIEHPKALADGAYRSERRETMEQRRRVFQELSAEPCRICHYSEFRREDLRSPDISSLVTSGNRSLWEDYVLAEDFAEFRGALEETAKPVLGICGGHQLIGMLLGGESAPLRRLAEAETDPYPQYAPGYLKEWGYYEVEFSPDPLFAGFAGSIVVTERHFWHLVRLPESLRVIARNRNCPVQAIRHVTKLTYGVQFHPEFHDAKHPDGRRVLENFFSLGRTPVRAPTPETS